MTQLITLDNIESNTVDSLIALATNNATLDGTTTLNTTTEIVSLPTLAGWSQQAKIQASDKQASDNFGVSVSISSDGNTAIVGAYQEDTGGADAGAAYIYVRSGSTWTQQAKIQSTDIQAGDYFGYSVSISDNGNTAIVGAWGEDTGGDGVGAAYIFIRSGTTWSQQAKLQSSTAGPAGYSDRFGASVDISGDGNTVIVNAWADYIGTIANAGTATIFTRSGTSWSQQAVLQSPTPELNDSFAAGVSISNDGNTAAASAELPTNAVANSGAVYIFTRSGTSWSQQAKLQPSVPRANGYFGGVDNNDLVEISGDGNTLLVASGNFGDIYVFTRSGTTWSEQTRIAGLFVGQMRPSISSNGNTIIIGRSPSVVFTRSGTTWTQQLSLQASDAEAGDNFGLAISLSGDGNTLIVGASGEDTGASNVGAAYVFSLPVNLFVFDMSQSSTFVHDTATGNFTANFTNVPTTNDRTVSAALIIPQDATGYLPTAVQIDGVSQTFVWEDDVVPEPSINSTDVVSFTLLRSGGAWTVLASLAKFGLV